MATKNNTKPSQAEQQAQKEERARFIRWVISLTLIALSLYLLAAEFSYFFTWSDDQILLQESSAVKQLAEQTGEEVVASNGGGQFGAVIGRFFVGTMFGTFALGIPVLLFAAALYVSRVRRRIMKRTLYVTTMVMILGSLTLGAVFGSSWSVYGTGLGGELGISMANWMKSYIGMVGLILLLILLWVLCAVYITRSTIGVVNKVGSKVMDKATELFTHNSEHDEQQAEEPDDQPNDEQSEQSEQSESESCQTEDEERESVEQPFVVDPLTVVATAPPASDDNQSPATDDQQDIPIEIKLNSEPEIAVDESDDEIVVVDEQSGEQVFVVDDSSVARQPNRPGRNRTDQSTDEFEVIDSEEEGGMTGLNTATIGAGAVVESEGIDRERIVKSEHNDVEAEESEMSVDLYDPTKELAEYKKPPIVILENRKEELSYSIEEVSENKDIIINTLRNFGIETRKIIATIGPTVTLYELEPAQGVKIARIKSLEDNIALDLKALSIRIIAPIPGKGTIGIEIPNRERKTVSFYSLVKSLKFQQTDYELPIVLGKTIQNETFMVDLTKMPHLLVAGATGQGKSVGLNVIISSLLYKKHPAELKFVMVDPKKVELSLYAKLEKHFLAKMESEDNAILTDTQKVVYTLNSLCNEMNQRYDLLQAAEVKKISEYNAKFLQRRLSPRKGHRYLPYIVVVIDEFADMIMTAGKEIETPITRLAQLARAVGIHLIIATQRPDVKVITGLIKANFPARIAFRVTTFVDSRTILDQTGANQLVGQGDMLMMLNGDLTRLQCGFIDTPEIERVVGFISKQRGYTTSYLLPDYVPEDNGKDASKEDMGQLDSMFEEIAKFVVQHQQGSTSYIQRRFSIGYNRAGRIMDQLEMAGIVGAAQGSKPREVLVYDLESLNKILNEIL